MSNRTALSVLSLMLVACDADPAPAKQVEATSPAKPAEVPKPAEQAAAPEAGTETKTPPAFMSEPERLDGKGQPFADHERRTIEVAGLARRGSENAKVVVLGCVDLADAFVKRGQRNLAEAYAALPNDVALYLRPYWNVLESAEAAAKKGVETAVAGRERTELAAAALVAAEQQGKIWELHDRMVEAGNDQFTREGLTKLAADAGLDVAQWTTALDADATKTAVAAHKQACNALGVDRRVPVYFINGRMMVGAGPAEDVLYVLQVELFGGFEALPKP